jgi:hypothetical protein
MSNKIQSLIGKLAHTNQRVKDLKNELKEEVLDSSLYKTIFEKMVSSVDQDGFEFSEKDAEKHALRVALKNFEQMCDTVKDDEHE